MGRARWVGAACALLLGACGGSSGSSGAEEVAPAPEPAPAPPPPAEQPVKRGDWTYYGTADGLSADVHDVSADEGGNVYVAGGDALYAKGRDDDRFLRFDAENAGLTKNCNDLSQIMNAVPATPFRQCPVISVAGASPGKAIVGFEGFGVEGEGGMDWALAAGGADVVELVSATSLARTRHVFVASPPHTVCGWRGEDFASSCPPNPEDGQPDYWWVNGRRKVHSVYRIVVNHDPASPMYGDAWLGGPHGTFSALLARTAERGWVDRTAEWGPAWEDARDVWEHHHPAIVGLQGQFLTGDGWALSIDPRDGTPWGSSGFRTAYMVGYGGDLSSVHWGLGPVFAVAPPYIDVWPDSEDPMVWTSYDDSRSISHCADGTLWVGSLTHGLARFPPFDPENPVTIAEKLSLPDQGTHWNSVAAVACDPLDSSLWVGLGRGGVMRLDGGTFELVDTTGLPEFARQPVRSIQIDRWSGPAGSRVVYFAFGATKDASGNVVKEGGVAAYDGP